MDALCALLDCALGFFPCYFLFGCKYPLFCHFSFTPVYCVQVIISVLFLIPVYASLKHHPSHTATAQPWLESFADVQLHLHTRACQYAWTWTSPDEGLQSSCQNFLNRNRCFLAGARFRHCYDKQGRENKHISKGHRRREYNAVFCYCLYAQDQLTLTEQHDLSVTIGRSANSA